MRTGMILTPRNAAIPMIARATRKPAFPSPFSFARCITATPSPGAPARPRRAEMEYRVRVRAGQLGLAFAGILAIPVDSHAAAGVLEKGIEERVALSAGGSIAVENLLGSIQVKGGGPPGAVTIEGRIVADTGTEEDTRALLETVQLVKE